MSERAATTASRSGLSVTDPTGVVGQRKPRELPDFKWVNTILGNLKTTLSGAYKAFKYGKYTDSYLGAFAYRFNRRFDLRGLVARLIVDVARCDPWPQGVKTHF